MRPDKEHRLAFPKELGKVQLRHFLFGLFRQEVAVVLVGLKPERSITPCLTGKITDHSLDDGTVGIEENLLQNRNVKYPDSKYRKPRANASGCCKVSVFWYFRKG